MSPADLITLPDAVSRAALVTELAVFESLSRGPTELPALSTSVSVFTVPSASFWPRIAKRFSVL